MVIIYRSEAEALPVSQLRKKVRVPKIKLELRLVIFVGSGVERAKKD